MFSSCSFNDTESNSDADIQVHRKSLKQLGYDLQNKQHQPQKYVIYDSVQGISYIRQRSQKIQKQQDKQSLSDNKLLSDKKQSNPLGSAKKFIQNIVTACKQNTIKDKILKLGSVIFHTLRNQEYDWLQRIYSKYNQQQLKQIPSEYIAKMKKSLSRIRFQIDTDKLCQQQRVQVLQQFVTLESLYDSLQQKKSKNPFGFLLTKDRDFILIFMISAYNIFKNNYSTYKRRKLKSLFKLLERQCTGLYNSIQVLRFLQNKDPILINLKPMDQLDLNLQVTKIIDQYLKINNLTTINTKIALVKVSSAPVRRRVVNLLISGFLSEDVDKRQQWNQLLACMPNSQVYGLQWESHTINRLIKYLVLSVKDIVLGKAVNQVITKDNPFVPAFQISVIAGHLLALVVHKVFPFQFINIISYSLGSQLIRAFVQKSIELNNGVNINKVITLGGVSDINEFKNTLQKTKYSINILNVKTKHDSVLKYVLKRAKPNLTPLGLNQLDQNTGNHLIQNMDVSQTIKGHFSFMTNFGTIAQLLMLNQE